MRHIGNRHIVGDVKVVVPLHVSIHARRSESFGSKILNILVDVLSLPQESCPVSEEVSIMVKPMHVDFKLPLPNELEQVHRYWVSLFWHDLKGSPDSKCVIHIHKTGNKVEASDSFHIMCNDGRRRSSVWPEPDERNPV
jgi:hypothetical protein